MEPKDIALLIAKESDRINNPNPVSRLYFFYVKVASEVGKLMLERLLQKGEPND